MFLLEEKLAWLGGIVDGEGCIMVKGPEHKYHYVKVYISNTDVGIINKCIEILEELGITYSVLHSKKKVVGISVQRIFDCGVLAKLLVPYMYHSEKMEKIDNLLENINNRKRSDGRILNNKKHLKGD